MTMETTEQAGELQIAFSMEEIAKLSLGMFLAVLAALLISKHL